VLGGVKFTKSLNSSILPKNKNNNKNNKFKKSKPYELAGKNASNFLADFADLVQSLPMIMALEAELFYATKNFISHFAQTFHDNITQQLDILFIVETMKNFSFFTPLSLRATRVYLLLCCCCCCCCCSWRVINQNTAEIMLINFSTRKNVASILQAY
jgi:hypothetical protein